jgi:transposase-like protein
VRPRLFGLRRLRHQQTPGRKLDAFANRPLAEPFAYLILDARYEKVREGGVVASQAVLIAIGIDWDGRRQILAVEMANRESRSSWKDFLLGLRRRGRCQTNGDSSTCSATAISRAAIYAARARHSAKAAERLCL